VLVVPDQAWGSIVPGEGSDFTDADVALKITLRSPRYRWIYPGGMPPRRFRGRDDALAGGAGRFGGQSTSVQRSNRFGGGSYV
jgi:hypothetical protein